MVNGRKGTLKGIKVDRDAGGFVALPWSVLDCLAYAQLSYPARALLLEIARQLGRSNNGRLLASAKYLATRGWTSNDVITRAKRELLEAGFIHETVKGHRPNKASWHAVTWCGLDRLDGYDPGALAAFRRSAYAQNPTIQIAPLAPAGGAKGRQIAPGHGAGVPAPTPPPGAMSTGSAHLLTPYRGDLLEKPSAGSVLGTADGPAT